MDSSFHGFWQGQGLGPREPASPFPCWCERRGLGHRQLGNRERGVREPGVEESSSCSSFSRGRGLGKLSYQLTRREEGREGHQHRGEPVSVVKEKEHG